MLKATKYYWVQWCVTKSNSFLRQGQGTITRPIKTNALLLIRSLWRNTILLCASTFSTKNKKSNNQRSCYCLLGLSLTGRCVPLLPGRRLGSCLLRGYLHALNTQCKFLQWIDASLFGTIAPIKQGIFEFLMIIFVFLPQCLQTVLVFISSL